MKKTALGLSLAMIAALGLGLGVSVLQRPSEGPVEPVWDFERCSHCRMHLAERAYAAQFHPAGGEPLFFDDPGCLLLWRAESGSEGKAYYRHFDQERWIAEPEAVFVSAQQTPMGWGFAVVDHDTEPREADAPRWSPDQALEILRQQRARSEGSR